MKLKICVVGCGAMSSYVHGPSFRDYAKNNSDTYLAGCCDLVLEKATEYKKRFGFLKAYTDYGEMLEIEKPNAVCLISDVSQTKALAVDIIKRGFPLIMEKPPGVTSAECMEIIRASETHGIPARVAFNRRYQPLMKELKKMLAGHVPYNIYYNMIRCKRINEDFSTTTIHAIDTVKYLADSDYEFVNIEYQYLPKLGEKAANIYINGRMESGTVVRMEFLVAAGAEMERCIINSENNTFLLNTPLGIDGAGKLSHVRNKELVNEMTGEAMSEYYINGGFYNENADFFDLIRNGDPALIGDVESGLQSVAIAECIRNREKGYYPQQIINDLKSGLIKQGEIVV